MVFVGFRPDSRGPFVSAKGPKTIDAQFGLIKLAGRTLGEGGQTRCAQTMPTHDWSDHPKSRTAGVGQRKERELEISRRKIAWLGLWWAKPFSQQRLENLSVVAQI